MEYQINKNEACTDTYYIYKIISLAFLFSSEKQKVNWNGEKNLIIEITCIYCIILNISKMLVNALLSH